MLVVALSRSVGTVENNTSPNTAINETFLNLGFAFLYYAINIIYL
jgi:hypothetical protein